MGDEGFGPPYVENAYKPVVDDDGGTKRGDEMDDNTLDNAGEVGREMADSMSAKAVEVIEGFPAGSTAQRVAIARIMANNLYDYADGLER